MHVSWSLTEKPGPGPACLKMVETLQFIDCVPIERQSRRLVLKEY